jgi:hypothetical protein
MMAAADPKVILRMGSHAEKDYFEKTIRFFDGIILGANLIESTPGATASLMVRFCGKKISVPYYVDPMTYAFGAYIDDSGRTRTDLDWIKSEQKRKGGTKVRDFKRSYLGLAKQCGYPFQDAITRKSAVSADDFKDTAKAEACCAAIADYQYTRLATEFTADPELHGLIDHVPRPAIAFAPYFYIEPTKAREWTDLVLKLATITARVETRVPVHAVICVDEKFLTNDAFVNKLITDIPTTGVKGVWFWFSRLLEDKAAVEKLRAVRRLVESLSDKVEVYNMHGGFFSLALCKMGMSGISHGVGYGEQKDVLPLIGNAMPSVRYYVPDIYKRLGVPDVQRCFRDFGITTTDEFFKQICDCVICKGVLADGLSQFKVYGEMHFSREDSKRQAQTPAAAKRCRFHFLLSRIRERNSLKSMTVADIRAEIQASHDKWGTQDHIRSDLAYLPIWKAALA